MSKLCLLLVPLMCTVMRVYATQPPATEVRAAWLTTNYGLDWPRNKISHPEQKRELTALLDKLQQHNFNTVLFQVRARGEVFYASQIEPLASVIVSPGYGQPKFDPLRFVIDEGHKRGMEVHAWMVTYPLGTDKHVRSLGNQSVTKKNASITKKYKNEWFIDPGNPRSDDYLMSLVDELVTGYDLDGIHFDYIRYPDNRGQFPDAGMYRLYGKGKSLREWRTDNITRFVNRAYDRVKSLKNWVQVSSAPLGRYRALNGNGSGWTALETVYQDAGKWMRTGKHDALYPMMYYKEQLFYPFVDDWVANSNGRIVVPGLGAYQLIELGWSRHDLTAQMEYTRKQAGVTGQAYFRTDNILSNTKGILNSIAAFYKYPAKLPPMKWLSDTIPEAPSDLRAEKEDGKLQLKWEASPHERITYNVYRSETDHFDTGRAANILAVGLREPLFEHYWANDEKGYYYFVTVSDSYHLESDISHPAFFVHSDSVK